MSRRRRIKREERDETNHVPVDRFTLVHFGAGVGANVLGLSLEQTLALAIGFEVVEYLVKDVHPEIFPHPSQDSPINAAVDVGAAVGGHALFDAWKKP